MLDTTKHINILKDALDTAYDVTKLFKKSRRDNIFHKVKRTVTPDSPGMRLLCPTRWTVQADYLKSVLITMNELVTWMNW